MAWEFLNSWVDVSWTIIQNSICRKRNQMILPCKSYRASQLCVLIKLSLNQLLSICLSNLSCKLLYFFFIITLFFHRHWEPCKMQIWEKHLHLLCHTLSIASPISICLNEMRLYQNVFQFNARLIIFYNFLKIYIIWTGFNICFLTMYWQSAASGLPEYWVECVAGGRGCERVYNCQH